MHRAPAVTYLVGRSVCHGWLLGLTIVVGMVAGLLWRFQAEPELGWQLLYATVLSLCSLSAFGVWWRSPCGILHWDGQVWKFNTQNKSFSGVVTVHLDLQWCLLLRMRVPGDSGRWFWLEYGKDALNWHALRRAVFCASVVNETAVVEGVRESGLERGQ
jgi:hypothetical protein